MGVVRDKRKPPRPAQCVACGERYLHVRHCPKSLQCAWTRCKKCGAISGRVGGKLKAIAGKE